MQIADCPRAPSASDSRRQRRSAPTGPSRDNSHAKRSAIGRTVGPASARASPAVAAAGPVPVVEVVTAAAGALIGGEIARVDVADEELGARGAGPASGGAPARGCKRRQASARRGGSHRAACDWSTHAATGVYNAAWRVTRREFQPRTVQAAGAGLAACAARRRADADPGRNEVTLGFANFPSCAAAAAARRRRRGRLSDCGHAHRRQAARRVQRHLHARGLHPRASTPARRTCTALSRRRLRVDRRGAQRADEHPGAGLRLRCCPTPSSSASTDEARRRGRGAACADWAAVSRRSAAARRAPRRRSVAAPPRTACAHASRRAAAAARGGRSATAARDRDRVCASRPAAPPRRRPRRARSGPSAAVRRPRRRFSAS